MFFSTVSALSPTEKVRLSLWMKVLQSFYKKRNLHEQNMYKGSLPPTYLNNLEWNPPLPIY